jgi:hypothetical protein|tara:strand:+ start:3537 stop:3776 length:240 start_codon:yes stop_codon:yes gene_type:complete
MSCYLCRDKPRLYWGTGYFCADCKRLQDAISIYGDRVFEVVEEVLFRTEDKQEHKIKSELKKEIKSKEKQLEDDKQTKL